MLTSMSPGLADGQELGFPEMSWGEWHRAINRWLLFALSRYVRVSVVCAVCLHARSFPVAFGLDDMHAYLFSPFIHAFIHLCIYPHWLSVRMAHNPAFVGPVKALLGNGWFGWSNGAAIAVRVGVTGILLSIQG